MFPCFYLYNSLLQNSLQNFYLNQTEGSQAASHLGTSLCSGSPMPSEGFTLSFTAQGLLPASFISAAPPQNHTPTFVSTTPPSEPHTDRAQGAPSRLFPVVPVCRTFESRSLVTQLN